MDKKDYSAVHVQKLRAAYPTLSPINKNDSAGTILAYFFTGDVAKTRVLVHWNDGRYERPYLYNDNPLEVHNPFLSESEYNSFLAAWEKHVSLGLCKRLNLEQ